MPLKMKGKKTVIDTDYEHRMARLEVLVTEDPEAGTEGARELLTLVDQLQDRDFVAEYKMAAMEEHVRNQYQGPPQPGERWEQPEDAPKRKPATTVTVTGQPTWDPATQKAIVPTQYMGLNRAQRRALQKKLTKIGRQAAEGAVSGHI